MSNHLKNAMIKAKINSIPKMSEMQIREELRKIRLQEATAEAVNEARFRIAKYHSRATETPEYVHPFDIVVD